MHCLFSPESNRLWFGQRRVNTIRQRQGAGCKLCKIIMNISDTSFEDEEQLQKKNHVVLLTASTVVYPNRLFYVRASPNNANNSIYPSRQLCFSRKKTLCIPVQIDRGIYSQ